jgi:hypothetical protein
MRGRGGFDASRGRGRGGFDASRGRRDGERPRSSSNSAGAAKRGICHDFRDTGVCNFGLNCRFSHAPAPAANASDAAVKGDEAGGDVAAPARGPIAPARGARGGFLPCRCRYCLEYDVSQICVLVQASTGDVSGVTEGWGEGGEVANLQPL